MKELADQRRQIYFEVRHRSRLNGVDQTDHIQYRFLSSHQPSSATIFHDLCGQCDNGKMSKPERVIDSEIDIQESRRDPIRSTDPVLPESVVCTFRSDMQPFKKTKERLISLRIERSSSAHNTSGTKRCPKKEEHVRTLTCGRCANRCTIKPDGWLNSGIWVSI